MGSTGHIGETLPHHDTPQPKVRIRKPHGKQTIYLVSFGFETIAPV